MTRTITGLLIPADGNSGIRLVTIPAEWTGVRDAISSQWIERVRIPIVGAVMYVDEEGLLEGKPTNRRVSGILYPGKIVGDALIIGEEVGPEGPDLASLGSAAMQLLTTVAGLRLPESAS